MVKRVYSKPFDQLTGLARASAQATMKKVLPPFSRAQLRYDVPEKDIIKDIPFAPGDRVQMKSGPEKGKIGTISSIYERGNCVLVDGLGGTEKIVLPKEFWFENQTSPVITLPKMIRYDKLRLVTKIKHEDGRDEDVVIHSIELGEKVFDPARNKLVKVRRAVHDKSITIPWPAPEPLTKSNSELATDSDSVLERSYFPSSIHRSPIPKAAVDQITNIHSNANRRKRAGKITAKDLKKFSAPEMPLSQETKKLLEELKKLPKRPTVEFSKDIEDYISTEIEKGLHKRVVQETEALRDYR